MAKIHICFSLVLFNHSLEVYEPLVVSVERLASSYPFLQVDFAVYDASDSHSYSSSRLLQRACPTCRIIHQYGPNIGFGSANNRNFTVANLPDSSLFIVANPDISFEAHLLLPLLKSLFTNPQLSCSAPLIFNSPDHIQFSVKTNPSFLSLMLGRFSLLRRQQK